MNKQKFNPIALALFLFLLGSSSFAQTNREMFSFTFDSLKYSGVIDFPEKMDPTSIVIIIPGSGKTRFAEGDWHDAIRSKFVEFGFAVCVWDKAGCGKSEGVFDGQQSVQSSAKEAIAAIEELKRRKIPGSDKIGLWGISRAGWICPLIIQQYQSIAFWISVSGTDQLDSYRYLLESNLRIEGRTDPELATLMSEFDYCNKYQRGGKTYDEFINSTKNLFNDPFCKLLGMGLDGEEDFVRIKEYYQKKGFIYDEATGLQIMVTDFPETLKTIKCPVLAIFGEKDSQVNWKSAMKLYEETIGNNPKAKLTIKTLANCNHIMRKCDTGGLTENLTKYNNQVCDGYYETMLTWLRENELAK